jgi:cell division cycle 2-like protein
VLHRDIKASNLLISKTGELKIADFGLARLVTDKRKDLTPTVITLWYRPPEILLGLKKYDNKADMWSVGCVLAELLNGRPLFPASSESEMLKSIWNFCGYPSDKSWPAFKTLLASGPHRMLFANFKPSPKDFRTSWRELRPEASEMELQLLSGLLHLDPQQRLSADQAAHHPWFRVYVTVFHRRVLWHFIPLAGGALARRHQPASPQAGFSPRAVVCDELVLLRDDVFF